MDINRHNYEAFFLLYIDDELTTDERIAVDQFAQQHPYLADELDVLMQARLVPDDSFAPMNLDSLYKKEEGISSLNYEEYFLLHVDNELTADEKQQVETFVLQHPNMQSAFTLLQQTKLPNEHLVFENKETLYQNTKRRIIPFAWMKMAAAAAVFGLAATLWLTANRSTNPTVDKDISVANRTNTKQTKPDSNTARAILPQQNMAATKPVAVPVNKSIANAGRNNTQPIKQRKATQQQVIVKNTPVEKVNDLPKNIPSLVASVEPVKITDERINTATEKNSIANNTASKKQIITIDSPNETASFAQPAAYSIQDEDEEERSIYIGSTQINKNKIRGLLKKATSLFDKKAARSGKTKTIQIASFEIRS